MRGDVAADGVGAEVEDADACVAQAMREIPWERIAQRDRQLRASVLLQRSARRFLNRTYEQNDAARTIQAFVRRHVLRKRRCDKAEGRPRTPTLVWRFSGTVLTPREEDQRRYSTYMSSDGLDEDEEVQEVEDEDDILWGGPMTKLSNSPRERELTAAAAYGYDDLESTAPLTSMEGMQWPDMRDDDLDDDIVANSDAHRRSSGIFTQRQRQYEVFLWQGTQHGLELEPCPYTGYPCVAESGGANITLPGMWQVREGDYLLTINDYEVHSSSMRFADVEQILEGGVRPAILRFRRPRLQEIEWREEILSRADQDYRRLRERSETMGAGLNRALSMSSVRTGATTSNGKTSSNRLDILKQRERTEASLCYVIWREEDGPLGVKFVQHKNNMYPEVSYIFTSGAAARSRTLSSRVSVGDTLLYINDVNVRNIGFKNAIDAMRCSPRPLVLTFRRETPVNSMPHRIHEF